jgi:sortase A
MSETMTAPAVEAHVDAPVTLSLAPTTEPGRPARRSWPLVIGRSLIAAGVVVASFIVFELVISGLAEQRAQAALLPEFRTAVTTTTLDRPTTTAAEGGPVALLQIPRIGLSQVVVQGTSPSDLKSGPGHLRASSLPGEFGNAVIAGRRTSYGGPFGHLDVLAEGDTIKVATGQGYFTYKVQNVRRVSPGQTDPIVGTTNSRLTLVTSDPAYLATGRLVVVAVLQGRPLSVDLRAPAFVAPSDLGLSGDPLGLGLGIIWGELLAAAIWVAWRLRRRWPAAVVYLLAAPVVVSLAVLTFSSFDLLLPGTL